MTSWIAKLIQVNFISIICGLIYGFVFWYSKRQTLNVLLAMVARTLILAGLLLYLLSLGNHLFILIAVLFFLITFWSTVFRLERFY